MPSTPKVPSDHKKKSNKPKYGKGWKQRYTDLELPSGELCQVKRPGVQGLIEAGVLQSLDTLTSIVQAEVIPQAQGKPQIKAEAVLDDPEKFTKMMETVDKIVCFVVVQPTVLPDRVTQEMIDDEDLPFDTDDLDRKLAEDERDEDAIYTDYIDAMDKMFIMNFVVGGSADLATFRAESAALVGGVPDGEEPAGSTV